MKITCPQCGTDQSFMEGLKPTPGALIACTSCSHVFVVPAEAPSPRPAVDDDDPLGVFGEDPFVSATPPPVALYLKTAEGRVIGPYEPPRVQQLIDQGQLSGGEDASEDQRLWMPLKAFPGISVSPRPEFSDPMQMTPTPQPVRPKATVERMPPPGLSMAHLGGPLPVGGDARVKADDFEFPFHMADLGLDVDPRGFQGPQEDMPTASALPAGMPLPAPAPMPFPDEALSAAPDGLSGVAETPPPPDLPAPVTRSGQDRPAALRGGDPMADLPAPVGPSGNETLPSWGIDLPAPKAVSDLPAPKAVSDLPAPKSISDLPAPKALSDLPAPKGVSDLPAPRGVSDLPAPKAVTDLPVPKVSVDLPGPKSISDLPAPSGLPEISGTPTPVSPPQPQQAGDVSPADLPVPKVDIDLPTPKVAIGRITPRKSLDIPAPPDEPLRGERLFDEVEGLDEPALQAPRPDAESVVAAPPPLVERERPGGARIWIMVGALGVVGAAAIGVAAALNIGPFAEAPGPGPEIEQPKLSGEGKAPVDPADLTPPTAEELDADAFAEVSDYRKAIAQLEQRGEPQGKGWLAAAELYAFGALEFPGENRWAQKGQQALGKAPAADREGWEGQRAAQAVALASLGEGALPEAVVDNVVEFAGRHPKDARSQHLLGLLRMRQGDEEKAQAAFKDAAEITPSFLPAQRMLAFTALTTGQLDEAEAALDAITVRRPETPVSIIGAARLAFARGELGVAEESIQKVIALGGGRLTTQSRARAYTLLGRVYLRQREEAKASKAFRQALEAWPGDLEAVSLLSKLLFEQEAYDQALTLFEKLQGAGQKSPELIVAVARSHQALKRPGKAKSVLAEGAKQFPEAGAIYRAMGALEARESRYDAARKAYEKALEVAPEDHQSYLDIVDLMVSQAKVAQAIKYLEEVVEAHPNSALLHFGQGQLMYTVGSSGGGSELLMVAMRALKKALELDPGLDTARHTLVKTYLDLDEPKEAEAQLQILQARGTYNEPLDYERGRVATELGRHNEAIVSFEAALERAPRNARYILALGVAHFNKGSFDEAEKTLRKAGLMDSNLTDAHYYMGRVSFARGRYDAASRKFKLAHDEKKSNLTYLYWLGRALEATGQIKQASEAYNSVAEALSRRPQISRDLYDAFYRRGQMRMMRSLYTPASEDFRRVLDYDDQRAEVWIAYGDSFSLQGRSDIALKHYKQALTLEPDNADAHMKAAQSLLRQDKVNDAVPYLRGAVKYNPKLAEPHYSLCIIYRDRRQTAQARKECEAYLAVAPKGDFAEQARRELKSLR